MVYSMFVNGYLTDPLFRFYIVRRQSIIFLNDEKTLKKICILLIFFLDSDQKKTYITEHGKKLMFWT